MNRYNPTGYFNIPEPALEPPDPIGPGYCPICGAKLDLFDPFPLCGICERDTREE